MEVEVNIDKDKINKMLVEKILDSAIGEEIEKGIKEYLNKLDGGYMRDNAIERVVKLAVDAIIANLIRDEYLGKIKEVIKGKLIDDVIEKVVTSAVSRLYSE